MDNVNFLSLISRPQDYFFRFLLFSVIFCDRGNKLTPPNAGINFEVTWCFERQSGRGEGMGAKKKRKPTQLTLLLLRSPTMAFFVILGAGTVTRRVT